MPEWQTIVDTLGGYGSQVQTINQGQRREKAQEAIGGTLAGASGYCTGCCVDWIRRVVLGGRVGYAPNPARMHEPGYQVERRQIDQTLRQGAAHIEYDDRLDRRNAQVYRRNEAIDAKNAAYADYARRHADYMTRYKRLNDLRNELVKLYNDNLANTHVANPGPVLERVEAALGCRVERAGQGCSLAALGQLLDDLAQARDALAEPQWNEPDLPQVGERALAEWTTYAGQLDRVFERQRAASNRRTTSKPFSRLEVVGSGYNQRYESIGEAARRILTEIHGLDPGRAIRIGVDMKGAGHSVAIFLRDDGRYFFYDPNYGIFECDRVGIENALIYLFGTAYPEDCEMLNAFDYEIYAARTN